MVSVPDPFSSPPAENFSSRKRHLGTQPPFHPSFRGFDEYLGLPYSCDMGCVDVPALNHPPQASCPKSDSPFFLSKFDFLIAQYPGYPRNLSQRKFRMNEIYVIDPHAQMPQQLHSLSTTAAPRDVLAMRATQTLSNSPQTFLSCPPSTPERPRSSSTATPRSDSERTRRLLHSFSTCHLLICTCHWRTLRSGPTAAREKHPLATRSWSLTQAWVKS